VSHVIRSGVDDAEHVRPQTFSIRVRFSRDARVDVGRRDLLGGHRKVGVGERVAVPRLVVTASEPMPKIAERCGEVGTPSGIANSFNDDLVVRAADVCRKDRRRVDPLLRETPL
jgi:hypothetical protein